MKKNLTPFVSAIAVVLLLTLTTIAIAQSTLFKNVPPPPSDGENEVAPPGIPPNKGSGAAPPPQASGGQMPSEKSGAPPPQGTSSNEENGVTPSPPPPPSVPSSKGGEGTTPRSTPSSGGKEVVPPSLPQPSPQDLRRDALRELNHAYNEFGNLDKLINYAERNGVKVDDIKDLCSLALDLYKTALKYFEDGNYVKAKIYAHLAVESAHGVRDLVIHELVINNVAVPPP